MPMSSYSFHLARVALLTCCLQASSLFAAGLQVELLDEGGQALEHAVISLRGPLDGAASPAPAVMDQIAQQFVPNVLAVRTGTAVSFPNRDNIRHHVYSFSPAKRFELRLYQGTPSEPVVFDKPGVVVLGCNIHDWMVGYVYITDDPWFAVSNAEGMAAMESLPAGRYAVTLWHPQSPQMLPQEAAELTVGTEPTQQRYRLKLQAAQAPTAAPPASAFGDAFKKAIRDAQ